MAEHNVLPGPVTEYHGIKIPDSSAIDPKPADRVKTPHTETQKIAGMMKVIRAGDHVLELQAGLGLVGAIAAKNGNPAKVLSFETDPVLTDYISDLYALNGLGDQIELRIEAVTSAPVPPETDRPTRAFAKVQDSFKPDLLVIDMAGAELNFLRHASLKGVRAIVIAFHPGVYGVEGMRECKSRLERAGFAKVKANCSRLVWTCTYDPSETPPVPQNGWATEKQLVENAIVVPPTEQNFVQAAGVLRADGSYCSSGALWRNGRALTIRPEMPKGDMASRDGTWLWGGLLWMHFGHFLVESTARLWALDQLDMPIDGILFVPKRPRSGGNTLPYQHEFIRLMGADVPMISLDRPTRVERLIVPGQGVGLGAMITGTESYRNAIARNFAKDIKAEGSDKIYISRSQIPSGRGNLIGEALLEDHLKEQGYLIFHPEKHDLPRQIATYKAARHIIAAEGSALHLLALVAQPDQQVAIIVRRPTSGTEQLQRHLHAFSGVSAVMLNHLIRSWKPIGPAKPRMWKGELDMSALQQGLVRGGFIADGSPEWQSLGRDAVKAILGDTFEEVV